MRFACPHCGEPAARPMVRSISGWTEYTWSGSSWHCSELHCSECHRPVELRGRAEARSGWGLVVYFARPPLPRAMKVKP